MPLLLDDLQFTRHLPGGNCCDGGCGGAAVVVVVVGLWWLWVVVAVVAIEVDIVVGVDSVLIIQVVDPSEDVAKTHLARLLL